MALTPLFTIQPAFTSGEISDEVNSRVDLDQYKSALLLAQNAVIRPFGSVCKRQGSRYIADAKYHDKPIRLEEFTASGNVSFLLEFGVKYFRVYQMGKLLAEVETVFDETDIPNLHFNQSADTMFICSGEKPVQALQRITDTQWTIREYALNPMPFDDINTDKGSKLKVANNKLTASVDMFTEEMVGDQFKVLHTIPMQSFTASGQTYERHIDVADYEVEDGKVSWSITTHGTWTGL